VTASDPRPAGLSSLVTRALTGVVFAVLILAVVIWGRTIGLGILLALVGGIASAEFYSITRREHRLPNEVFGVIAAAAMPLATVALGRVGLTATATVLIAAALGWHVVFRKVRIADTATTVFGAMYVGFLLAHLVLIRQLDHGTELVLAVILGVWANDVLAYLVGSTTGRHKMAPTVSPNKSWEGLAAGVVGTVLVWIGFSFVADLEIRLPLLALVGVVLAFAGVLGDLAESRFKREAGVKDTGTLFPGHGGVLDRFDSLILVSVAAYYLLIWAGMR